MQRAVTKTVMLVSGAAVPLAALAQGAAERADYWHHDWGGGGWGHMIFGSVAMLLFLVAVVVLAVAAVRWLGGGSSAPPGASPEPGDRALAILRERYARGEIEREEFERKRHDLEAH